MLIFFIYRQRAAGRGRRAEAGIAHHRPEELQQLGQERAHHPLRAPRARRVALSALHQPRRAVFLENAIDERRNALVRLHPVVVPAAEHAERDARERVCALDVLEPLDEVPGVVCWLPFEGSVEDERGPVSGEVSGSCIEGLERRGETYETSIVSARGTVLQHKIFMLTMRWSS